MDEEINWRIIDYAKLGNVRFKKHALVRSIERGIKIAGIAEVLQKCQIIAEYPEDQPLKSYLVLGFTKIKRPLHVVVALDEKEKYIWVISVYEPDSRNWDKTFVKRLEKWSVHSAKLSWKKAKPY